MLIGDNCIFGQIDGQFLRPCLADNLVLKNLTVNREHKFLLNVTTRDGETNSSAYSWFIGKHFFPLGLFFSLFLLSPNHPTTPPPKKKKFQCLFRWLGIKQLDNLIEPDVEKYYPKEPYFFISWLSNRYNTTNCNNS